MADEDMKRWIEIGKRQDNADRIVRQSAKFASGFKAEGTLISDGKGPPKYYVKHDANVTPEILARLEQESDLEGWLSTLIQAGILGVLH